MRPICLFIVGHPPDVVRNAHGDFLQWFRKLAARSEVELNPIDGLESNHQPDVRDFAGVVITGSPASLTKPEPWMEVSIELVRDAHHHGTPLLGVCFGHQLIGAAFGGHVIENPKGWELSTYEVEITESGRGDPLFEGIPDVFAANLSHHDILDHDTLSPMNGVRVLARSDKAEVQAVAAGDATRGVQFHPEFSGAITRAYLETRRESIADDARNRGAEDEQPDRLAERTRDCPHSETVFDNFVRNFVLHS